MKNLKFDIDLIISIVIAGLASLLLIMFLGILALISWWLIYILLLFISIPICYAIRKKYKEDPNIINDFIVKIHECLYDYDYDDNNENSINDY